MSHYCPRRDDTARWFASQQNGATFYFDPEAKIGRTPLEDEWSADRPNWGVDAGLPTCTYCGSLRPQDFIEALHAGHEVHGTDKRYKAYIILPNPNAGNDRVISASSDKAHSTWESDRWVAVTDDNRWMLERDGWGRGGIGTDRYTWMMISPDSATSQAKFYFQHIAHQCPERAAFYDWYTNHSTIFYSGAPLGLHLEHILRNPKTMTAIEATALAAFKERAPEVLAP